MRFARAKGSKASNERVPELATSWHDMKKDLLKKNEENELQTGESKYTKKAFYNAEKQEKVVKWSEFPFDDEQIKNHKLEAKKTESLENQEQNVDKSKYSHADKKKKKLKLQADNSEYSEIPSDNIDMQTESSENQNKNVDESEYSHAGKKKRKRKLQSDNTECSEKPSNNIEMKTKSSENQNKKVDESEYPLAGHKNRKRKLQTDNSEKPFDKIELQGSVVEVSDCSLADQNCKKNKSDNKACKKIRSPDCSESKEAATKTIGNDRLSSSKFKQKASPNNLNKESNTRTSTKQSNKFKQFKKEQKCNFSYTSNIETGEEKSFHKKNDIGEYKRRKPINEVNKIYINGNEVEISHYDGFPIKKIDAERLDELKEDMINRGLPSSEIKSALKLERRKAEKSLAREKKKVCFNCRRSGHTLSECPVLRSGPDAQLSETGICFKCGSTEHTHFECRVTRGDNFKFAQCFICKEQGHIARQCPDNNKGLYPKGGACRICGDVTHLKKDCPKYQYEQEENKIIAHTIDDHNIESLENESKKVYKKQQHSQKIIKF